MNLDTVSQSAAFRINTPRVAHQTLDGETIIIDFSTGCYFSTNATGAVIWHQLGQNVSINQIIQQLRQRYVGDETVIRHSVEQFLAELQRESLIIPLDGAPLALDVTPIAPDQFPAPQLTFQAPSLAKYTDMQDLLLLDAIHDVDEQGWPTKKDGNAE